MASKKDITDFMAVLEESMEKKMEKMEVRILQEMRANPPRAHPEGPNNQRQPLAQPQRKAPTPEALKTTSAPPPKTPTNPNLPNPKTAEAVKQTWAAISAAGIDTEGFILVPIWTRKKSTGPGIGNAPQHPLPHMQDNAVSS